MDAVYRYDHENNAPRSDRDRLPSSQSQMNVCYDGVFDDVIVPGSHLTSNMATSSSRFLHESPGIGEPAFEFVSNYDEAVTSFQSSNLNKEVESGQSAFKRFASQKGLLIRKPGFTDIRQDDFERPRRDSGEYNVPAEPIYALPDTESYYDAGEYSFYGPSAAKNISQSTDNAVGHAKDNIYSYIEVRQCHLQTYTNVGSDVNALHVEVPTHVRRRSGESETVYVNNDSMMFY